MIFISAQPDDFYFLWQLQLQLLNFNKLGINPESIHVLIGYNPLKGLSKEFENYILENNQASFFIYPDERKNKSYLPSLRPHILAKHFRQYPILEKATVFYHDSDIVFSKLPDFELLNQDENWYTSDTRSYLDSNYIRQTAGEDVLKAMCQIIGIQPSVVAENDVHAGGAQYLLKSCSASFWEKAQTDCENIFLLLETYNKQVSFCNRKNNPKGIQAWCADMWSLWWNALLAGKQFKIHSELNFCWADSPIEEWQSTKILHYTGAVSKENKTIFRKVNYIHYPPFYDNLNGINKQTCSYSLTQIMQAVKEKQSENRIDLKDVSFLILVRVDSPDRLENLYAITNYLTKYFNTTIFLLEVDSESKIDRSLLHNDVQYSFIKDNSTKLHLTKYKNLLLKKCSTTFISFYDTDVVFPIEQIVQTVTALKEKGYAIAFPYDGSFVSVDSLLKTMFTKLVDPELLEKNCNKFCTGTRRSFGGAVFLNRQIYIYAGMDNEYITSWGPEDIERVKRMAILGYPAKRINGNLYHLPHQRSENSGYQSDKEHYTLMSEFLKICSMKKTTLQKYIQTWHTNGNN